MSQQIDPRSPDILAWLISLLPEKELPTRMALRAISDRVRGDRAWSRRINELCAELATTERELARYLRDAAKIEERLRAQIGSASGR